jgi:UDP-N-acetylglucosamine 2-epimerase (non-hydrolysing)
MKVMTVFGTRPEIIRLSLVMKVLDAQCDHITVHTGQNFDESLSDIFFRELKVREPNVHLGIRSNRFGEQAGQIFERTDKAMEDHRPDRVLILGDTNSALAALPAARRGIPVFHMEAGNRCYDDRVPEEVNRRVVDHSSTILLPYTQRSKENLVREGIERERIYVTGNPINEVLSSFAGEIGSSPILDRLGVKSGGYFLVTLHRAENVDIEDRLRGILTGLERVSEKYGKPVLASVHPRTRDKITRFGIEPDEKKFRMLEPLGLFDFIELEKNSAAVLTDSGTVQEECCIFEKPNVTLRDVTERPETVECGSNILSGGDPQMIVGAIDLALSRIGSWNPPSEYLATNVSATVANIVLGYSSIRRHF